MYYTNKQGKKVKYYNTKKRKQEANKAVFYLMLSISVLVMTIGLVMDSEVLAQDIPEAPEAVQEAVSEVLEVEVTNDAIPIEEALKIVPDVKPISVKGRIRIAFDARGLDSDYAVKIAKCESSLNTDATNGVSTASGLFQYTKGTWKDGVRWRGLDWTLDDRFNANKAIDMTVWFVEREGWGRWECVKHI